jgi:hypothetical protein
MVGLFALTDPRRQTPLTLLEGIVNIWQNVGRDNQMKPLAETLAKTACSK